MLPLLGLSTRAHDMLRSGLVDMHTTFGLFLRKRFGGDLSLVPSISVLVPQDRRIKTISSDIEIHSSSVVSLHNTCANIIRYVKGYVSNRNVLALILYVSVSRVDAVPVR